MKTIPHPYLHILFNRCTTGNKWKPGPPYYWVAVNLHNPPSGEALGPRVSAKFWYKHQPQPVICIEVLEGSWPNSRVVESTLQLPCSSKEQAVKMAIEYWNKHFSTPV